MEASTDFNPCEDNNHFKNIFFKPWKMVIKISKSKEQLTSILILSLRYVSVLI